MELDYISYRLKTVVHFRSDRSCLLPEKINRFAPFNLPRDKRFKIRPRPMHNYHLRAILDFATPLKYFSCQQGILPSSIGEILVKITESIKYLPPKAAVAGAESMRIALR